MQRYDVGVIGGGIAGLSAAYALIQRGKHVCLIDKGEIGRSTSWAAAGMLAPINELEFQEVPLLHAGVAALETWHRWAQTLPFVKLDTHGTLDVALGKEDVAYLDRVFRFQQQLGLDVQWLTGADIQTYEPSLSKHLPAAIRSQTDVQVEHRQVLAHLPQYLQDQGVAIQSHCALVRWEAAPDDDILVHTNTGQWACNQLLLCTGVSALSTDVQPLKIYPVRGQMVALAQPATGPLIQHGVRIRSKTYGNAYLSPKPARIVLGSTSEEMGYEQAMTAGGLMDILRKCWFALPGIYDLNILETWSGLRPATLSRLPVLDALPQNPNVFVLNGLYRHGILLGPWMGEQAAMLMCQGERHPLTADFRLPSS